MCLNIFTVNDKAYTIYTEIIDWNWNTEQQQQYGTGTHFGHAMYSYEFRAFVKLDRMWTT